MCVCVCQVLPYLAVVVAQEVDDRHVRRVDALLELPANLKSEDKAEGGHRRHGP